MDYAWIASSTQKYKENAELLALVGVATLAFVLKVGNEDVAE